MKKIVKNFILPVIGIILVCLIILALYFFTKKIWSIFCGLNATVAAGIIAASATIIVSVISISLAKHFEHKAIIAKEHRDKKIPVYEELLEFIFLKMFLPLKTKNTQPSEEEMGKFMMDFIQKIIVWGSDEVVESLYQFRQGGFALKKQAVEPQVDIMVKMTNLLLAIRKDLGHKNKNINEEKLLGLFINDLDQITKKP